jgi:hypothetical protein
MSAILTVPASRRAMLRALAAAGASLATVACGRAGPPALTAQQVLQKASAALRQVKSLHFVLTATGGLMTVGSGLAAKQLEGDAAQPDRLKVTATATFGKMTVDLGLIVIGNQQYITNPITKQWQALPGAVAAPNLLDPRHGAAALLGQATDLQKLANETVNGVDTYHISGHLAAARVAALVGGTPTTGSLAGDVWVGSSDFLVRQIRLVGPVTTDEPPGIQRLLVLSNFNETVSITAPT